MLNLLTSQSGVVLRSCSPIRTDTGCHPVCVIRPDTQCAAKIRKQNL